MGPNLLLLGVERVEIQPGATAVTPLDFVSYPFSHSLLALTLWALLFAAAYWAATRWSRAGRRVQRPASPGGTTPA